MVFNATTHAATEGAQHSPFEFEWKDVTYTVPSARMLSTGALRQVAALSGGGDALALLGTFDHMWPADAVTALMEMPPPTAAALAEAWLASATADEASGKSLSPSPQTNGSGRP